MDDELPLSALARAPSRKVDDDTPLSALAGGGGAAKSPGSGRPSVGGAKGKAKSPAGPPKAAGAPKAAAGKAKAKAGPGQKRKRGSSSSSYSSSYSSSSDSEEGGDKKKKPVKRKGSTGGGGGGASAKARVKKKASQQTLEGGDDEEGVAIKKRNRSMKEDIVAQLLCRWWFSDYYIANDWPPQNEDFYEAELKKSKMRKVTVQEWEWIPEEDGDGRRKVYELSQYRGVYRNSSGDLVDLRPKDTCPCLNTFMKKDMATLCSMLISAYENQLKDLAQSKYKLKAASAGNHIKTQLTKVRHLSSQALQMKN